MFVEHAIFTSIRSGRNEGYQLAARSRGIATSQVRDLVHWGPSHDSLYESLPNDDSVSCHALDPERYCVSYTKLAGREYSGRGGNRVYTQMFLLPGDLFARFGNSPFRVFESLAASGQISVLDPIPAQLEPLKLLGRAMAVNTANLEHVVRKLGAHRLASLVTAALKTERLGVSSKISGRRLLRALFDLLPPWLRCEFSVTTGLKVSAVRDFRLVVLPLDVDEQRRAIRQVHLEVLDLTSDPPTRFGPSRGWPQLIHQLLRSGQYDTLAEVVESSPPNKDCDLDLVAEQQRERLDSKDVAELMSF